MSVGEKGASALINSLEHNKTMTELWLPWGLEEAKGSSQGEEENTFYIYNVIPVLLYPQVYIFYIISNSVAKSLPLISQCVLTDLWDRTETLYRSIGCMLQLATVVGSIEEEAPLHGGPAGETTA